MNKGFFVTGTGTDIGKTYVTALLIAQMRKLGLSVGYYKAAISGADSIPESDAGYVNQKAGIYQKEEMLVSYLYKEPVSPHLAARLEGNPLETDKVLKDYRTVREQYEYVVCEGSGGIMCPLRYDKTAHIFLEDIIKMLALDTVLVADAGLGTINSVVLTAEYMKHRDMKIRGIILNHYTDTIMQRDNRNMIEELTGIPVVALVRPGETELNMDNHTWMKLLEEEQ